MITGELIRMAIRAGVNISNMAAFPESEGRRSTFMEPPGVLCD